MPMTRKGEDVPQQLASTSQAPTLARGVALFVGLFSLANAIAFARGGSNQNIWWIDVSPVGFVPAGALVAFEGCAGLVLVIWATSLRLGMVAAPFSLALSLVAFVDTVSYWRILASGQLARALPVPLSLVVCIVLFRIAAVSSKGGAGASLPHAGAQVALWLAACLVAFPLLQVAFFGTTDYRSRADAVVVLGAQVHEDGTLSRALRERMDTAIGLYEQGYSDTLIVSGGTGREGVNEAEAMCGYAVASGIPKDAVLVDPEGSSSLRTVENSLALAREHDLEDLMVTSSFYHVPRLKMMYLAHGMDVRTVPTVGDVANNGTFPAFLREVPAWWVWWLRCGFGS